MTYVIDKALCINCGYCRRVCPTETIHYFDTDDFMHTIYAEECIDCNACVPVCPGRLHRATTRRTCSAGEALEQALAKAREWARKRNQDDLLKELAPRAKFRPSVMPEKARRGSRKD